MRRLLVALLALLALALARPAMADEPSPRQRALILLRVLVYDRNLAARAGPEVVVALAFSAASPGSRDERDQLLAAFDELSKGVVAAGRPVRAVALPYHDEEGLRAGLAATHAVALYACQGLEAAAGAMARAARQSRVLAAAGSREHVEAGFPVAIVHRQGRAALVLAPSEAAAAGADLDPSLFTVAELVGEAPARARGAR